MRNPSVTEQYRNLVNNRVSQPYRDLDCWWNDRFLVNIRNTYASGPTFEDCEVITAPLSIWGSDGYDWQPNAWSDMSDTDQRAWVQDAEWYLVNPHNRVSDLILIPVDTQDLDIGFQQANGAYQQLERQDFTVDEQHKEWLCHDYNLDDPEQLVEQGIVHYSEAIDDYILPRDCQPAYGLQRVELPEADQRAIIQRLNDVIIN